MVVSIGRFPIFTWEMVGNHQTSIYKWLFGVPGCCWVAPPPSNSHHQDYEPFLVGNPYKPSFPLLLGGGTTQIIFGYKSLNQNHIFHRSDILFLALVLIGKGSFRGFKLRL